MRYNPEAQYVPGKHLVVADTLSKAPQPREISEIEWEIATDIAAIEQGWPLTSQRLSLIREATQEDEELSAVFRYTDSGWSSHASSVAPIAQPHYGTRGHLSIHDGLIKYDDRLIIPRCLRADILQKIHEVAKFQRRFAKESYTRFYNQKHGAKPLTQFEGEERVCIKTDAQKVWGNPTVVVRADTHKRILRFL